MHALFDRLLRRLRELQAANGANVTITFALASIPIVGFVGAAVDYSHAHSIRAAMQSAADSTALMLSKEVATLNSSQVQSKADEYFKALFTRPEATALLVKATYTESSSSSGSLVKINATSDVKTNFMGIMGFSELKLAVESQVKWGNVRLRVALALDVTGSMSADGKMDALKIAAKGLLDQLKAAATKDGDVYVSIIPFSKDVNAGKTNYTKNWVRWDLWENVNGSCSKTSYKNKKDCENNGKTWTADNHDTWNGCITDRDQDYDTKNTAPSPSDSATQFPAEQYSACPAQLKELSYDWNALKAKVDDLKPTGNTNQGIGMQWAYQSLTASPFTIPPKDANYKYSEVIILMSDGLNTQNRFSTKQSAIDAREAITCSNAKAAKITIYAVQVNTGGDPTQSVMKNCASDPAKFFELKKANQLVSTFNSIGTALSNLRIAE
jgi:Flp pilus assembly protein TadG